MLPNLQHYTVAQSVREAVLLLTRNEGARIIAGGTVIARSSSPRITQLVDITKAGMDYIAEDDTGVRIGATVTFSAARESPTLQKVGSGIIVQASDHFSSAIVRNMATIGGDVLSPYNWADMPPILLVLDAKLRFMGARELIVPVERYAEMRKELGLDLMLLAEIVIEKEAADRCGVFLKFGRTKSDIGIVTIAGTANVEGKKLSNVRLAVAGVTSQAVRLPSAEAAAEGKEASDDVLAAAATAALQDVTPTSDVRATGEYRSELLQVAVKRALAQLASKEGSS